MADQSLFSVHLCPTCILLTYPSFFISHPHLSHPALYPSLVSNVSFTDDAVLSGSMSWQTYPSVSLTTAKITLTLTLSLDYYPTVAVDDQIVLPGSMDFGDSTGTQQGAYTMQVGVVNVQGAYTMQVGVANVQVAVVCRCMLLLNKCYHVG